MQGRADGPHVPQDVRCETSNVKCLGTAPGSGMPSNYKALKGQYKIARGNAPGSGAPSNYEALKGHNIIAWRKAPGTRMHENWSPERAK